MHPEEKKISAASGTGTLDLQSSALTNRLPNWLKPEAYE